jgi:hypothetical protein
MNHGHWKRGLSRRVAVLEGVAAGVLAAVTCGALCFFTGMGLPAAALAGEAGNPGVQQVKDERITVNVGGSGIDLAPPSGHCFLDPAQQADARLIGILRRVFGGNVRMLAAYADCGQLKSWRAGKRKTLDDHGQYIVPLTMQSFSFQGDAAPHVKKFCDAFRRSSGELMDQVSKTVKQRIESAMNGVKVNEQKILGVLEEDNHACYFGLLQRLITEYGDPKTQIGVTAYIFAGGKAIGSNLYTVYKDEASMVALLGRQRENAMVLERINAGRR